MTTTNVFQGLQGDKSSSRVLRPPGGASSNIFGGDDSAPVAPKSKGKPQDSNIFGPPQPAGDASRQKKDTNASNLFAESPAKQETPTAPKSAEQEAEEDLKKQEEAEENNNAEDKPAEAETPKREEPKPEEAKSEELTTFETAQKFLKRNQGTYNPITGESKEPSKQQASSTKVRQPPGGASSGLW